MGDALAAAGWDVIGIGLPGAISPPPAWPILTPASLEKPAQQQARSALATAERVGARAASALLAPAEWLLQISGSPYAASLRDIRQRATTADRPIASLARSLDRRSQRLEQERRVSDDDRLRARFWALSIHLSAMKEIAESLNDPALWIANDWWMLPIADAGQRRSGGVIVYDSHELATEEYAERPEWRRFQRPIVAAVESGLIGKAEVVTSVSPGITQHLQDIYAISKPAMTLRNAPVYQETVYRPAGEEIRVLYHGLVRTGRGLEATIESVSQWRPEFSLTIRGPAEAGYRETLEALARAAGVSTRVTFAPPEPMTQLVQAARAFDIGIMALPDNSLHNRHALPNKLFEYLMAGLAIAVTDLPEMGALARETKAGVTIASAGPDAIAAAINSITPAALEGMRIAALDAARLYNWGAESAPVLAAYASAMDGGS